MRIVLKVSSNNEYCNGGCEFALVDLTRELAEPHVVISCSRKTCYRYPDPKAALMQEEISALLLHQPTGSQRLLKQALKLKPHCNGFLVPSPCFPDDFLRLYPAFDINDHHRGVLIRRPDASQVDG